MNLSELAVIVVGLFAGYWVVGKLFFPRRPAVAPPALPAADASRPSTASAWHEVLQVPADAPAEVIRDAYRRMISLYHPDKVDALGQELKDLAATKAIEITSAYRAGMWARGLDP